MNPTPATDTQRLRELLAAATPGPWRMVLTRFHGHEVRSEKYDLACGVAEEDAELIAALRNEAPALLDEIDRLREQVVQQNTRNANAIKEGLIYLDERDSLRRENEELKAKLR